MNTQERIQEFFDSHPDASECYEALGKVFSDKEKAQKFLAGVSGRFVTTHSRKGQNFERISDRLRFEMTEQENLVNDKQAIYEDAPAMEKQKALGEWQAAKDKLNQMKNDYDKQLGMEEKEELLAKEDKPIEIGVQKELTVVELKAKVSAQQAIVDTNTELIGKMTNATKKNKAEKVQADEVKKLESLKTELKAAEEKETAAAAESVDHEVTQEDLDNNPELAAAGVKIGDTIKVPKKEAGTPEEKQD